MTCMNGSKERMTFYCQTPTRYHTLTSDNRGVRNFQHTLKKPEGLSPIIILAQSNIRSAPDDQSIITTSANSTQILMK